MGVWLKHLPSAAVSYWGGACFPFVEIEPGDLYVNGSAEHEKRLIRNMFQTYSYSGQLEAQALTHILPEATDMQADARNYLCY